MAKKIALILLMFCIVLPLHAQTDTLRFQRTNTAIIMNDKEAEANTFDALSLCAVGSSFMVSF